MRPGRFGVTAVITLMATAALAATDATGDKSDKPRVSCDKIVETYKLNKSVDETSDTLFVDESRVTECLKAAGITPNENDR